MHPIMNLSNILNNYVIGSSYNVKVTHINNPHSFFIQPIGHQEHMPAVKTFPEVINPSDIKQQEYYIFKSTLTKEDIRGMVSLIMEDGKSKLIDMYAIDHGFVERSVPVENLLRPVSGVICPALAVHCKLLYCVPISTAFDPLCINAMKHFIGQKQVKIIVEGKESDRLLVKLFNSQHDDVSVLLTLTGYTWLSNNCSINKLSPYLPKMHQFSYKRLHVGDVLNVRLQSGHCVQGFYVVELNDYKSHLKELSNFTYFCKQQRSLEVEDLKENLPVAVPNQLGRYERGLIKNVKVLEERLIVRLVDTGCIKETRINNLKLLNEGFLQKPAMALYCKTGDDQVCVNELSNFFNVGFEFVIVIRELGVNFDTPNLVDICPLNRT